MSEACLPAATENRGATAFTNEINSLSYRSLPRCPREAIGIISRATPGSGRDIAVVIRSKGEQHAIGCGRSDKYAVTAADAGIAYGVFGGRDVTTCECEASSSTLGKSRQRDVGISPAQLILCQE